MVAQASASDHKPELQESFINITGRFKLCPNRLWAVTGERLHDLLPEGPLPSHKDHDQCSFDFCGFSQRDYTAVEQRHECGNRDNCRTRLFPRRLLDEAINEGRLTAWKLDGTSLIEWPQPYMAVSHVWADGTGAGMWPDGEVNECLYAYFEKAARKFRCEGIWWDTICIPKGKNERNKALNNMHYNYQDARITLVHDCFIRSWDWVNAETACFVILISPWFSRGWTALELAMSRKVKVIFNGPFNNPIIKDLDEQILARERKEHENGLPETRHEMLSKIIRNLRTGIASLDDLLSVLGPRYTSWPRDMLTIAKLLLEIETGPDVQPQEVQSMILKTLGKASPGNLFHNSSTTAKGTSWCPTRLFDMPRSDVPPSLHIHENLDVEGKWQPLSHKKVIEKASFVWHLTHPLLKRVLEKGLGNDNCVLLAEYRGDQHSAIRSNIIGRAILVRKTNSDHKFQFLGAVYFHPPLPTEQIIDVGPQNITLLGEVVNHTEYMEQFRKPLKTLPQTDDRNENGSGQWNPGQRSVKMQLSGVMDANACKSESKSSQNGITVIHPGSHRWTELHYAIWRGQVQVAKALINNPQNKISETDRYGRSALHLAAERGNFESVQLLHPVLDLSSDARSAVLEWAVWGGSSTVVEFLLENNYKLADMGLNAIGTASELGYAPLLNILQDRVLDLNEVVTRSTIPLHYAVENGHQEAVQVWMDSIPDLEKRRGRYGQTALHTASATGHMSIVKMLLENHDPDTLDNFQRTPLQLALIYHHPDIAMLLILKHADIDIVPKDISWTPLHFAASYGEIELAKLLISRRSSMVNSRDQRVYWTPLHFAAMNGHLQMTELLIHHGAKFERDSQNWTPGMVAMFKGHLDVVKICGGDVKNHPGDVLNLQRWTDLHFAAIEGDSFHFLLKSQYKAKGQRNMKRDVLNTSTRDDEIAPFNPPTHPRDYQVPQTALSYAATENRISLIKLLLKWGADIQTETPDGATCLHYAARNGSLRLAKFLVTRGASIDAKDPYHETALHWAAKHGNRAVAEFLIKKDSNVHLSAFGHKFTPLHYAAAHGYPEIVDILISAGANMRATTDPNSHTPLSLSVQYNRVEVFKLLIQRGVDILATKYGGASMLHLAAFEGRFEMARLLINNGASINEIDMNKSTPLHYAAWRGQDKIIELLAEYKANLEAEDYRGYRPLHVAKEHLQNSATNLLLKKGAKEISPQRIQKHAKDSLILDIVEDTQPEPASLIHPNPSLKITSLHINARSGDVELVKTLTKCGAKPSAKDHQKVTPLHLAARFGHLNVAQILVGKESKSIWAEDCNGMTPLVYAAASGSRAMVDYLVRKMGRKLDARSLNYSLRSAIIANHCGVAEILLSHKADMRFLDGDNIETWRYAVELGHISALELLIENKFDVNEADKNQCTALHIAAALGDIVTSRFLIEHNTKINALDAQSRSPIDHAAKYSNKAMLMFLSENKASDSGMRAHAEFDRRCSEFVGRTRTTVLNSYGYQINI